MVAGFPADQGQDTGGGGGPLRPTSQAFEDDRFAATLGVELLALTPSSSQVRMVVTARHTNGADVCHGGVLFALADAACAYVANGWDSICVTAGASIDFLGPAREGETIQADARRSVTVGRRAVIDVTITVPAEDRVVAAFRGVTTRIRPLDPVDGPPPPVAPEQPR